MPGLRFWRRTPPPAAAAAPSAGSVLPGRPLASTPVQAPVGPPAAVPPAEQPVESIAPVEPVTERLGEGGDDVAHVETTAEPVAGPRVGLVFGDGTHVVLDPADPRAVRFAAIAEELNR